MPVNISGSGATGSINTAILPSSGTFATQSYADTAGGLIKITTQTFSAVSSVNVDNCFSATYQNYRLIVNTTNTTATTALSLRLRVGGADASGSNYYGFLNYTAPDGTQNYLYSNGATSLSVVRSYINGGTDGVFSLDILRPFDTDPTNFLGNGRGVSAAGNEEFGAGGGLHSLNTSYDGFSLLVASGTMTGNLRIYGYRN